MKGLWQERDHLGFEKLLLPEEVESIINYDEIRSTYVKHSKGAKLVKIKHFHLPSRKLIEGFESENQRATYDNSANNKKAYDISFNTPVDTHFDQRPTVAKKLKVLSAEDKIGLFYSLLKMNQNGNRLTTVSIIVESLGLKREFAEFQESMINLSKLPYEDYLKKIALLLKSPQRISQFKTDLPNLYLAGVLSSNNVETVWSKKLLDELSTVLTDLNGAEVFAQLLTYPEAKVPRAFILDLLNHAGLAYGKIALETARIKSLSQSFSEVSNWLNQIANSNNKVLRSFLMRDVFVLPHSVAIKNTLEDLLIKADLTELKDLSQHVFSSPHSASWKNLLAKVIDAGNSDTMWTLAKYVFSKPHASNWGDLLEKAVMKMDPKHLWVLGRFTFSQPHSVDWKHILEQVIRTGNAETLETLAKDVFSKQHSKDWKDLLEQIIRKADSKLLQTLENYTFTQEFTQNAKYDHLRKAAKIRDLAKRSAYLDQNHAKAGNCTVQIRDALREL